MTLLPFHTGRRAGSTLSAMLMVPALLASATLTFAAPPASTPEPGARHDNKTYTLVRTFKVKEVSRYKAKSTVIQDAPQGGPSEYVTNMVYHETIKEIKPNGNAVFTSEVDSASVSVNGMDRNLTGSSRASGHNAPHPPGVNGMDGDLTGSSPTITATIDKQGHVLDTKIEGGDPTMFQLAAGIIFNVGEQGGFFPDKPIKVGETWKFEQPAKEDIIVKEKIVRKETGTATFLGMDTLNGTPTYKVKMVSDSEDTIDDPRNAGAKMNFKSHEEEIVNFDRRSGKMVKMTATLTATVTSDGVPSGKSTRDLTITLITGDDKTPAPKTDKPMN